jgi:uncharacterized protein (TIGR02246 family)
MASGRTTMALAALLFAGSLFAGARAQEGSKGTAADEAEIKQVFARFYENFSRHDAQAASMAFTEDADFTNMRGVHTRGRPEIEQRLDGLFKGMLRDATRTDIVRSIRYYTPELAAVDADTVITGTKAADGSVVPPRKGLMIALLTKKNGHWLISDFHEEEYPPAPARASGGRENR